MQNYFYLYNYTDIPARPEIEVTPDDRSRVVNISWTAPINNADLGYYAVSVDDDHPTLTQNTSILYNLRSSNNSFSLRAVDRCGQQGHIVNITMVIPSVTFTDSGAVPMVTLNNGAKKGIIAS